MDFRIKKISHIFSLLVVLCALLLIVVSPILSYIGTLPSTETMELNEGIILFSSIITVMIFIGTPFIWYVLVNNCSLRDLFDRLKLRKQGLDQAILWGILATIGMFAVLFVIGLVISAEGINEKEITNIEELASNLSLGSMIFIVLFQSASEEIFFRGFLLEKINSISGKYVAIITTAVLFGIAHLSYGKIYPVIMTAFLGLILGFLVIKTKNLFSAIIAHILFNFTSFLLYYLSQSFNLESLIL